MTEHSSKSQTAQQHICTLHGWLSALLPIQGNYAVIIHSDPDCTNLIGKTKRAYGEWKDRFFCTNLDDSDIVLGKSIDKLELCLKSVLAERTPSAVLVLASCMSLLIRDNVEACIKKVQKTTSTPIIYKNTSGFSFNDPKEVIDECGLFLAQLSRPRTAQKDGTRSINLIGFDYETGHCPFVPEKDLAGLSDIGTDLRSLGDITVNAVLNPYAPLREWKNAMRSALNVTVDRSIYQGLCTYLQKEFDIRTIEAPYPVGIRSTLSFYTRILEHFGLSPKTAFKKIGPKIRAVQEYTKKHAKKLKNYKLMYNIATNVDFTVTNSAKEGLLFLELFRELGLDITVLIQGSPEKENKKRISAMLKTLQVTEPFELFGHCGDAYTLFPKKGPTIVVGSYLMFEQAVRCGHAFIDSTKLSVGLNGHKKNLAYMLSAIQAAS